MSALRNEADAGILGLVRGLHGAGLGYLPWFSYRDRTFDEREAGEMGIIAWLEEMSLSDPLVMRRSALSIQSCFSSSSSRYTDASATSTHSSFSRSRTILGPAACILRMLFCRCVSSVGGGDGRLFLERRNGASGDLGFFTGSSIGHSHASGGRHVSGCLPLVAIGQPDGPKVTSSFKIDVVNFSDCDFGTGKSNVSAADSAFTES